VGEHECDAGYDRFDFGRVVITGGRSRRGCHEIKAASSPEWLPLQSARPSCPDAHHMASSNPSGPMPSQSCATTSVRGPYRARIRRLGQDPTDRPSVREFPFVRNATWRAPVKAVRPANLMRCTSGPLAAAEACRRARARRRHRAGKRHKTETRTHLVGAGSSEIVAPGHHTRFRILVPA